MNMRDACHPRAVREACHLGECSGFLCGLLNLWHLSGSCTQDEVEYEGNISAGWGQLSGLQEADRFWWASLGVFTGHSETLLHSDVKVDDDQPLWWAKGGQLIGDWLVATQDRVAPLPSLQDELFPSDLGSLTPTQEWFGTNESQPAIANMLSDNESFNFLHFMRNGTWSVSLGPAQSGTPTSSLAFWQVAVHTILRGSKQKPSRRRRGRRKEPQQRRNFEASDSIEKMHVWGGRVE